MRLVKLDFHVHSNVSDGHFSPEGVLELALRHRLRLLAITDHDAIEGFDRAESRLAERRAAGDDVGELAMLAGVEFSTSLAGDEVHILGYFPRGVPAVVRSFLVEAEHARTGRIREAVETLTRLGYPVKYEEVKRQSPGRTIGRSHLARAMVESGIAMTTADAFRRFLATERGIVPASKSKAEDVVRLIVEHEGLAVLAHPYVEKSDAQVRALVPHGLGGLELYGKKRRGVDQLYLEALAAAHGLVGSAGTDWHGKGKVADFEGLSIGKDKIGPFLEKLGLS